MKSPGDLLPSGIEIGIFIEKFNYKEKPMFGIEPNLDKVFGGMLKPKQQKLVDYTQYRMERDSVRYDIFGRRVCNSALMWHESARFWFDRKERVIIPELSPYMDVLGAKLFPATLVRFGIHP
jgi:hypothetical protein